jgi:hypothetical protein
MLSSLILAEDIIGEDSLFLNNPPQLLLFLKQLFLQPAVIQVVLFWRVFGNAVLIHLSTNCYEKKYYYSSVAFSFC